MRWLNQSKGKECVNPYKNKVLQPPHVKVVPIHQQYPDARAKVQNDTSNNQCERYAFVQGATLHISFGIHLRTKGSD